MHYLSDNMIMDVGGDGMDSYLQQTFDAIEQATAGITADELAWHPEGKWSAAEILEHLTLTYSGTAKGMQRVLSADGNGAQQRTLKNRLFAFVVTGIGYMPTGRKSPAMVVPAGTQADPVGAILRNLKEMDEVLSDVERTKGLRARVVHPVIGPLTVRQWRKFHFVHTRHHMKQVMKLRELAS
jgi:hypothetical protein